MPPYVIINCAMSADGKIALPSRKQTRISNEDDIIRVHRLRHECDAVLVGIGTVLEDDPKLTVKERYISKPKQPIRIVLDSLGRTPESAEVLSSDARTIVFISKRCRKKVKGTENIVCGEEEIDIPKLCKILDKMGIKTLLVEGGESVIWSFLKERLADEFNVFIGSMIIGGEDSPTPAGGEGAKSEKDILKLELRTIKKLGDGILLTYDVKK